MVTWPRCYGKPSSKQVGPNSALTVDLTVMGSDLTVDGKRRDRKSWGQYGSLVLPNSHGHPVMLSNNPSVGESTDENSPPDQSRPKVLPLNSTVLGTKASHTSLGEVPSIQAIVFTSTAGSLTLPLP